MITILILGVLLGGATQAPAASPSLARVENQIEAAQKLMQAADFDKALEVLNPLMQGEQAPPDVFILIATCHLNRQETALALEVFERGMSLYPAQKVLEEFYVRLLTNYVPVEQMKEKLDRAVAASPRSPVLLRASAYLEIRLDPRSEQARKVVEQLMEVAPDNPNSHLVCGRWAMLNKQAERVISEWETALSLAGDDSRMRMDILTLIGEVENTLNRADRAEAAFKKALEINAGLEKPNAASAFFYAEFLGKQGRSDESQAVIDQILRWAPTYGPSLVQRALHLARTDRRQEAVAAAEGALAGQDLNPQQKRAAHVLLARTYFLLKRTADAERHQQWLKEQ